MNNEIRLRPRPITSLFAQHWVTIRHNQNLISQANTITRSVSQFGFEMNCGNELWQDWWSVQTGLTQCYTHIHLPTTRPHDRITLYQDINCCRESNMLWDIQELFRYPTLHRMVIIVLFQWGTIRNTMLYIYPSSVMCIFTASLQKMWCSDTSVSRIKCWHLMLLQTIDVFPSRSHYIFMTWLSYRMVVRRPPSQWPLFKTVFQHLCHHLMYISDRIQDMVFVILSQNMIFSFPNRVVLVPEPHQGCHNITVRI